MWRPVAAERLDAVSRPRASLEAARYAWGMAMRSGGDAALARLRRSAREEPEAIKRGLVRSVEAIAPEDSGAIASRIVG